MTTLKLGVMASLPEGPEAELRKARELGLPTVQVVCWKRELLNDEMAARLVAASKQYDVEVTTLWTGLPGPAVWNFIEGPATIGLVPELYRAERVATLKQGADFAVRIGAPSITTHVGFIPENPGDPLYPGVIDALNEVVGYCKQLGVTFCFETGQETPTTLLRVIEDLGYDNLGVNLDPANLLLYGKANPVDALDIIGKVCVRRARQGWRVPDQRPVPGRRETAGRRPGQLPGPGAEAQGAGIRGRIDYRARDQRAEADRRYPARHRAAVGTRLTDDGRRTMDD